jgi:predicted ATPase/DNA-binding SARP family transcriptional activator
VRVRYRLLGSLEVEGNDGVRVVIPAPKRRALLAFLLLQRGRPASRARIVDALWGEEAPDAATESLFAHVSRLRREIGAETVRTIPGGYRLVMDEADLDIAEFERDLKVGRQAIRAGDWASAVAALQRGLDRWRGPALVDFIGDAFARSEMARLDELRLTSLEDLMAARLELGRHSEAVAELEAMIETHRLRERFWEQLILALYRAGRQADALARYREIRRVLRDELGLDPSPTLKDLQLRILRQDPSLGGPRLGSTRRAVSLPASASSMVGRRIELDLAVRLLSVHRVLTLTGPGGIGKSRLAVTVAQAVLEEHPDGTQFVDLSAVTDPERVIRRIGDAVGGGSRPGDVIGRRRMLLVLDNFEQVLDAAPTVSRMLEQCPNLRVIVTSRAPLRIRGEQLLEVPPLPHDDAATLFRDRAAVNLTSTFPAELVATIVDRLDGLPLALELAAARTRALALSTIRDNLNDRLGFLTSGARDAPDRHRTLRETIDWSYRLLTPEAQAAFRALSVLAAGFDLDAAMTVGGTTLDVIASLVEHSLLRTVDDRYSMLETIREFARGQATTEEASSARDRLLAHYRPLPLQARLAAVGQGRDDLAVLPTGRSDSGDPSSAGGQRQDRWLTLCALDQGNLRAALEWADTSGDAPALIELFLGVGPYWTVMGLPEEATRWTERALEAARTRRSDHLIEIRLIAIEIAKCSGDFERAIDLLAESIADATRRADWRRITDGLDDTAWAYAALDRDNDAILALRRSRQVLDSIDGLPARERAHMLGTSTEILLRQGQVDEADEMCRQFVALVADLPDWVLWNVEAQVLSGLVDVAAGRRESARATLLEVVRRTAERGDRYPLAHALDGLAMLDAVAEPGRAARFLGMADRARVESRLPSFYPRQRAWTLETVTSGLGAARSAELIAEGHDVPVEAMGSAVLIGVGPMV